MNVFEAVKGIVTTRQVAERYGIRVNRYGMAVCPFHNDKNPSMKVNKRFHCFACQADGDAVDFVSSILKTMVIAIGAGLGVWGGINLAEGYGNDNPGAKSQGIKQLMAGGGVILIGTQLIPQLASLF